MKQFFLYRLFKYSKTGFSLVVLFVFCYGIFFYKRIDAVLFPYNAMFSIGHYEKKEATAYAMKINAVPVTITGNAYWKKDFLEESLSNYCKYKKNGDKVFMTEYLTTRIKNRGIRDFLLERLTPDKIRAAQWPSWYAAFAGYEIPKAAVIELVQYQLIFENNAAVVKDSSIIYKINKQ